MAGPYALTDGGMPTRPYADPTQVPPGAAGRTGEMLTGVLGDPGSAATSLGQSSERQNLLTAQQFGKPTSVLQQVRPSLNAESAQDYARVLPGGYTLPTQNGQSQSSWSASNLLRMQGQDAI